MDKRTLYNDICDELKRYIGNKAAQRSVAESLEDETEEVGEGYGGNEAGVHSSHGMEPDGDELGGGSQDGDSDEPTDVDRGDVPGIMAAKRLRKYPNGR